MAARSMVHLNGNVLAAVDVETTGLQARFHDPIQVCVLPLDANLEPYCVPFYMFIQPKRPHNRQPGAFNTTKIKQSDIDGALDSERTAGLFDEWFLKLNLPLNKSLIPLAHNWIFDYGFMEDWLGYEAMNHYFFGHYRDTMAAALFSNDFAEFRSERHPHPRLGLGSLCEVLGVENPNPHDALGDSIATARCYREMIRRGII